MIDHTGIGVADVGRSAAFYDAALEALGLRRVMQMGDRSKIGDTGLPANAVARFEKSGLIASHSFDASLPPAFCAA
jgi:catechol 2,3-dioxygenase-like lactoylglutathione lyase family enzyme